MHIKLITPEGLIKTLYVTYFINRNHAGFYVTIPETPEAQRLIKGYQNINRYFLALY